jgi:hypothetical protein
VCGGNVSQVISHYLDAYTTYYSISWFCRHLHYMEESGHLHTNYFTYRETAPVPSAEDAADLRLNMDVAVKGEMTGLLGI